MKALLLENISPLATQELENHGFEVISLKESIESKEVLEHLKDAKILGIRSRSQITQELLNQFPKIQTIGCFCIGTNQVNTKQAQSLGIPVFNAPFSNTRSVAEMVLGEIIILFRNIHIHNAQMHHNVWNKSAVGSAEVRGKTLGIVGYGRIGSQLGILAENIGMKVVYFDIERKLALGNAQECNSLNDVLIKADVVSLHVPQTPQTKNMIGEEQLSLMKKGSKLINASRGNVVEIEALVDALKNKHISSVALDVFPHEPEDNSQPFESPLSQFENALLTPHIGGSTKEAQENIALEVVEKLINFTKFGSSIGAVNFPEVLLSKPKNITPRVIHIHKNTPGMLEKINNIFGKNNININSQILQTEGEIGYAVMDISGEITGIADELESIPNTIRARVLKNQ